MSHFWINFICALIGCLIGHKTHRWLARMQEKETRMREEFERLTALHERRLKRLQEGKNPFTGE